jgi:hypothetical protein
LYCCCWLLMDHWNFRKKKRYLKTWQTLQHESQGMNLDESLIARKICRAHMASGSRSMLSVGKHTLYKVLLWRTYCQKERNSERNRERTEGTWRFQHDQASLITCQYYSLDQPTHARTYVHVTFCCFSHWDRSRRSSWKWMKVIHRQEGISIYGAACLPAACTYIYTDDRTTLASMYSSDDLPQA